MINVSDNIKTAYFTSTTQIDRIKLDNNYYYITNVEYSDNCYQDGNVFGTAEARQLEFEIENSVNVERKEYEYQTGIEINGEINWISLGKFITYDVEVDDITGITKVVAMDYMIKSNVLYDHTSLDYSLGPTIKAILEDALEQAGLELGNETFVNSDFRVYSDQFEDNALIRNVIIACAQISGTFAKVRNDNKVYLINPNKYVYGNLVDEGNIDIVTEDDKIILLEQKIDIEGGNDTSGTELNLRDYSDNEVKRNTHEINTLVLGMANVEGENVVVQDEQMIIEDGTENKIVINDNPFAYTQTLRTQLITPIFNSIKGFSYTAFEMKYQGLPYLECGDRVTITTLSGNKIESYCFRYTFKSPNGLDSTLQAPSLTDAEVLYENVENLDTRLKRTEIVVDKENQQIQSIVTQIGDREGKTTTITQDIDHIESLVEDSIDLTDEITNTNPITLLNCRAGNLLELRIRGNSEVFKPLVPTNSLVPSATLKPLSSQIEVHSENLYSQTQTVSSSYYMSDFYFYSDPYTVYSGLYKGNSTYSSRYLEIEPFTTYHVVVNKEYLPNDSYLTIATFGEDIFDKLNGGQETYFMGNVFDHNSYRDADGWHVDETKIELTITTGENDKYLFIRPNTEKMATYKNYQLIDLEITTELKKSGDYYDEYVIKENQGYELRRIGEGGVIIENPEPTNVRDLIIPLTMGTNYIDIPSYTATTYAKWVIFNDLTNYFATELDLRSSITQSSNEIKLSVMETVTDEFLARQTIESSIDLGILDDEGYIAMKTNKMSIDSDNFTLTTDGEIVAKKGTIAGLEMLKRNLNTGGNIEEWSLLQKVYGSGSSYYLNGLMIPNQTYGLTFIVAGMPTDSQGNTWDTGTAPFRILSNGNMYVKNINMNGDSGYVRVNYDSGRLAMKLSKDGIWYMLDDSGNGNFFAITRGSGGTFIRMYDTPYLGLVDSVHELTLIGIWKQDNQGNPSQMTIYTKTYYSGGTGTAYEIATKNDICDESVKKNIKKCKQCALDKIDQIEFKQFDWNEKEIDKKGHIDIGITAQQIKEIDENFVELSTIATVVEEKEKGKHKDELPQLEKKEVYSINVLNITTTALKGIQELNQKVKEQQETIDKQEKTIQDLIERIEKLEKGEK